MHAFQKVEVPAGSIGVHWFEQSSFAIQDPEGTIVFVDPYFTRDRPPERFLFSEPTLVESELRADYVLLTHDHGDHTDPESTGRIVEAWPEVRFIGPRRSIERVLQNTSAEPGNTIPIAAGESVELGSMSVYAVYSKPPAGDAPSGIAPPDTPHLGYVVESDGVKAYFSGDLIRTFADLDELVLPVAALKPDIGFLTTHPVEEEFPSFEECVAMAQRIGLKTACPAHYACFTQRTFDPELWAAAFPPGEPETLVIPRNTHVVYSPRGAG